MPRLQVYDENIPKAEVTTDGSCAPTANYSPLCIVECDKNIGSDLNICL